MHLISAKLYRPQTRANLIERPHLLARLDDGLNQELILISAPPGFGKSTLAGQWLAGCGLPVAWVSLDEADNDLARFLSYICAAVSRAIPDSCAALQALLATAQLPAVERLADLLVEELHALPVASILVLNDYHNIRAAEVQQIMRQILRYRPPRLHTMILTRTDPPLYLGQLRAHHQITEIRAANLAFDLAETGQFLNSQLGRQPGEAFVRSLLERTEGWAIGLQLAAIALQSQSPQQLLARFSGSHRLLAGYLVEEVMAGLPDEIRAFLTRTALVDRFCAPLGEALLAGDSWSGSGQATIARLEAENLFIISLDDEGRWYRYHELFRDFLLHRLQQEQGPAGLARLHRRAGAWLAQAGLIEDALRHILAAGDETEAADLVETNLHPLLNRGNPAPELGRWLDMFPEQTIQAHPGLRIAQLYLFALRWDLAAIAASIDYTIKLVEGEGAGSAERRRERLAVLDALQGYLLFWQGRAAQAIPLFRRGLDYLADPVAYSFTVVQATQLLAQAQASCGQREAALALLRTALAAATAHHRPAQIVFLGVRALILLQAGELAAATATAGQLRAAAELPAWSGTPLAQVWRGWAHYFLGTIHYEQNDLDAAAQQWRQVEAMRYQVNPGAYHDSLAGLALIAQGQDEAVQAMAYAQAAREFAVEQRSPPLLQLSEALAVRLALRSGNLAEAQDHAQELHPAANQVNTYWLEPPSLTALRALLAAATPDTRQTAGQLAAACLRQAENAHNTRRIIQAAAMQALVWRALRRKTEALAVLARALALAEPGGFVRTFLDLGAPLAELLQQLDQKHASSGHIKHLLAAFAVELPPRRELAAQYMQLYQITPLTQRELELMDLIALRLTVKEMAGRLVISPNTVKKHVSNIYTKLGVNNRRQAIARAREVGLLPPA